jgi:hypothetical protein
MICYLIGIVVSLTGNQRQPARQTAARTPSRYPVRPTPAAAPMRPAAAPPPSPGGQMPAQFQNVKVGQRVTVKHPVRGDLTVHVDGSILYSELMQQGRSGPWQASGNAYPGFWLEGNLFLLNWQNRLYLLDESTELSDADIQRDFAPHARKFAQSDQTADVYFAYPPASWKIVDIGKFRVDQVEGQGIRFRPGSVGRFIHASGDGGRALVVEDYEGGGGGEDTAWIGYSIEFTDLKA